MKNNKGFTIIEVIICLCLIILISGTMTAVVLTKNKNNKKHIQEVTKKIQEAASVYLSINKDNNNSIEQNIYNGGTGYVIPLKTLINEGYVSQSYITTLKNNIKNFDENNQYLLLAEFANSKDKCDENVNVLEIEASWLQDENKKHDGAYYICNYQNENNQFHYLFLDVNGGSMTKDKLIIKSSSEDIKIDVLPRPTRNGYIFDGWYQDETKYENINLTGQSSLELKAKWKKPNTILNEIKSRYEKEGISGCKPTVTSGLCMIKGNNITENNKNIYYFSGGEEQKNYIKIANNKFYIVRTTEDDNIKLVSTTAYDAKLYFKNISSPSSDGSYPWPSNYPTLYMSDYNMQLTSAMWNNNRMTFKLEGMFNLDKISGWEKSSGANGYETEDGNNSCDTNNKTWLDNESCIKEWCFKRWTSNKYCDGGKYKISFLSPMHSIYLDTKSKYNSYGINSNFLATTKWCTESKYNINNELNTIYTGKPSYTSITKFPEINLTCDENNYVSSTFGLLNESEYFLISNYPNDGSYYGSVNLYKTAINNEVSLDGRFVLEIQRKNTGYNEKTTYVVKYRPAFTIKGSLKINGGDGSKNNPYTLTN